MKKPRPLDPRGVTLIEILIAMGLIAFAMGLLAVISMTGAQAWQKQSTRMILEREAENTLYILSYNLRQARSGSAFISKAAGEDDNSMAVFTVVGKTAPTSIFLRTTRDGGGKVLSRRVFMTEPYGATPTYGTRVLASNVLSLQFSYPKIADPTRIMVNLSLSKTPLKTKLPVTVHTQETIYLRD